MDSRRSLSPRVVVAAIFLAGALAPSCPAMAAPPLRFTHDFRWFTSSHASQDLAEADLDGDGVMDLVLTHPLEGAVSVLLGDPCGGFRSRVEFDAGRDPAGVLALDVDGDGRADVVVANRATGALSFLHGRGDGTLAPPRTAGTADSTDVALARDLDGDDIVDLAMATGLTRGNVGFARGRGDGTFDPVRTIHRAVGPARIVAVEMPGRRHHGLAVAGADGTVAMLVRTRGHDFVVTDTVHVAGVPQAIVAADIDRDGLDDFIVALDESDPGDADERGGVRLLRGRPNGRFAPTDPVETDFAPAALLPVDLDGDGWTDLVAADRRGGGLGVYKNDRSGRFLPPAKRGLRLGPGALAAADWNGDGRPDIAGLEPQGRAALLVRGNGDGSFGDALEIRLDFGPEALWLGDLGGDGVPDVAAIDLYTSRLLVLRGDGAGAFEAPAAGATYDVGFAPGRVVGARLRPAGPVDLVLANATYEGFLSFGRNRGDGTFDFAPGDTVQTGGRPVALAIGDLDGNAAPDAVTTIAGTNTVLVLLGDGLGRFHLERTLSTGGSRPVGLALGDLDGDGRTDLVVAGEGAHAIVAWKGDGAGGFAALQEIRTGLRPRSVALADLDGDGRLDLVAGQGDEYPAAGRVVVYTGIGDGTFGPFDPARTARVGAEPGAVLVADLDGVTPPDVIVTNDGDRTVTFLPGARAHGYSFGAGITLGTVAGTQALAAGDLDRDGRIDLVTAGPAEERLGVLLNRTGDPEPPCAAPAADAREPVDAVNAAAPARALAAPNPAPRGASVAWAYDVPEGGADVRVGIYTVAGRHVARLAEGFAAAGAHVATWSGRDDAGRPVAPGVYFLRAEVGRARATTRIILLP